MAAAERAFACFPAADPRMTPAAKKPPRTPSRPSWPPSQTPLAVTEAWLAELSSLPLNNTVTEVTRTSPTELTVVRNSQFLFTGLELVLLSHWLADAPVGPIDYSLLPQAKMSGPGMPRDPTNASMLKLGVNIDHVATLRQARYRGRERGEPDPIEAALICESAGAHGITAHLREDRRHIQDRDVRQLRQVIKTRLNLEMANVPEIVALALEIKPDIVCMVPERRAEVTTEGGLDAASHWTSLAETRRRMNEAGIEVSLFIAPDAEQVEAAARVGSQFIELHTGAFAENFHRKRERAAELERLIAAANQAHSLGLRVNAGHGLNYQNLAVLRQVPHLVELNIGHSIISRAVVVGLATAVREMLLLMGATGETNT
jgi:pyridoxine 5-phosphate synthase